MGKRVKGDSVRRRSRSHFGQPLGEPVGLPAQPISRLNFRLFFPFSKMKRAYFSLPRVGLIIINRGREVFSLVTYRLTRFVDHSNAILSA